MADETKEPCTCPICNKLSRKATALRKCNHIFCWKCINGKITKHDWKCCPVCYVEFGPDPLLIQRNDKRDREDHILESLRTKGFSPVYFESSDDEETPVSDYIDDEETESENSNEEVTDESENSNEEVTDESENSEDESENSEDESEDSDDEEFFYLNPEVPQPMDTESESDSA